MENSSDAEPTGEIFKNPKKQEESEEIKIKNIKYPFSGKAVNMIDTFLVLGYEQKTIERTFRELENKEPDTEFKTRFKFFTFDERPSVVNDICYDYSKSSKNYLENDLILEILFPNMPEMYFLDIQYLNTSKEQKILYVDEEIITSPYSIIFSMNPQDNSGSKNSYNGLGYVFFVPQEHKVNDKIDGILYVPIIYVIISEFPYFYHFNEICRILHLQMRKENDEIPIDILIYNIVKYLESPIKKSINLILTAPLGVPLDECIDINKVMKPFVTPSNKDINRIPSVFFNQLSGYPFMDINLSFIFNLIPYEIIVQVFIFTFLEHDILFYSSRPEILNMVMYIFSNFNYPFNDSIYYWHVVSVSISTFINGTSSFVGKTCSSITGIANEYKNYDTNGKISEHFVLDIDNKNFIFTYLEETEDVKDTMTLFEYIKQCTSENDEYSSESNLKMDKESRIKNYFNDKIQLYDAIQNLMDELQRRAKKVTSTDYNTKKIKPSFFTFYENESELECQKANMRLQKAFFTFISQILQNFLNNLTIEKDFQNDIGGSSGENKLPSIVINIKEEELNEEEKNKRKLASKAGVIFKNKFKDCSKYNNFVVNFCQYHDTIDVYKIPYTFINEFLYYSHAAVKYNLSEVDVFKLIDQFYGKKKVESLGDILQNNEKEKISKNDASEYDIENIYSFNFNSFIEYYKKNLRAFINRGQEDDKIFLKVKGK